MTLVADSTETLIWIELDDKSVRKIFRIDRIENGERKAPMFRDRERNPQKLVARGVIMTHDGHEAKIVEEPK